MQWRWPIGKPLVDGFGDGLYEVRSRAGRDSYRMLFCVVGSVMVLLHGFQKKTQRTPRAALARARRRKTELENAG